MGGRKLKKAFRWLTRFRFLQVLRGETNQSNPRRSRLIDERIVRHLPAPPQARLEGKDRHDDLPPRRLGGKSLLGEPPKRLADVVVVVLFEAIAADVRGDVLDDRGLIVVPEGRADPRALNGAAAPWTGRRRLRF